MKNDNFYLSNKNFMLLWIGQTISNFGDAVYSIAIMWYVMSVTGSAEQMGVSLICSYLPIVLLSPVAGIVADRYDRKKILVICDLLSGVFVSIVAVLAFKNQLKIWEIYIISLIISSIAAFFGPCIKALIPEVVEKATLIKANSMNQVTTYMCQMLGTSIAGILIALISVKGLFIINSISFIISAIFNTYIKLDHLEVKKEKMHCFIGEIKDGIKYCLSIKEIMYFMLIAGIIINFCTAPIELYIPIFSKKVLEGNSSIYGLLMAAIAVGGVLAAAMITSISKIIKKYYLLTIGIVGEGISIIFFGMSRNFIVAFISLTLLGMFVAITNIALSTIVQTIVPNNIMGRIAGFMSMLAGITVPLGYLVGGIVSEKYEVTMIMAISGLIVTAAGLATVKITWSKNNKIEKNQI